MAKTKWSMDATHSEVHFKVRHLMVSWVTGSFRKFDATVETEGHDITTAKVNFTADLSSISTNNEQRDAHLRSTDFFDAENHPQLIFESGKLEKINEEEYTMHGTLTIRGTSKPITLKVEFGGIMKDPWGNTRAGFALSGKLNRKDFGVNFSMLSETGGVLLGDEVAINANAEFVSA
ncbi:MAG TPA: YceI family protein [Chryseolinea sp.]|nr:YceI family protein [Chryseolinea sp.]